MYDHIEALVGRGKRLDVVVDVVCEFNRIVTQGEPDARKPPGVLRVEDVVAGRRDCTPWQDVPRLMAEHCPAINKACETSIIHGAAYAMWVINWIHPFTDGNGRTARTLMFALLTTGYGRMFPGTTAIPYLIAKSTYDYLDALVAGHRAWRDGAGEVDISEAENFVLKLVEEVLGKV